jgi:hypothetical protein
VEIGGGTLDQSIKSTALDGQINSVGRLSNARSTIDANVLYSSAAPVRVVFAGSREQFVSMNARSA